MSFFLFMLSDLSLFRLLSHMMMVSIYLKVIKEGENGL